MNIEGIEFPHAYTFGPLKENGRVDYTTEASHPNDRGPGVYVVTCDDELIYIGSYQRGVQKRWVFLKDRDIYHFKKPHVSDCLKKGKCVKLFALGLDEIKKQINCTGNDWVNAAGVEARLISRKNPKWNVHGQNHL